MCMWKRVADNNNNSVVSLWELFLLNIFQLIVLDSKAASSLFWFTLTDLSVISGQHVAVFSNKKKV